MNKYGLTNYKSPITVPLINEDVVKINYLSTDSN